MKELCIHVTLQENRYLPNMKSSFIFLTMVFVLFVNQETKAQISHRYDYKTICDSVLKHFEKEPNKSKTNAAKFLLSNINMREINLNDQVISLINDIDSLNKTEKKPLNSIYSAIENFYAEYEMPQTYYEYETISAKDLIKEIDEAFDIWNRSPYAQNICYSDFCEYILPPVIGHSYYTPWRQFFRSKYSRTLNNLQYSDDRCNSSFYAASKINYELRHRGGIIKLVEPPFGLFYPAKSYQTLKVGTCKDYSVMAAYAMRSLGIPVGIDFIIQWPHRNGGHYWNTLISDNGLNIPFTGAGGDPGMAFYPESPMGKVYRMTYAFQNTSLKKLNEEVEEKIPFSLSNAFMKDVTMEYCKVVELKVKGNTSRFQNRFMYLAVFNNAEWIPVDYSLIMCDIAKFSNVGVGVVYLPCYWCEEDTPIQSSYPIEVKRNGEINALIPNYSQKISITFTRKFPKFSGILGYSNRMLGGYIEASNDSNFQRSKRMVTIERFPDMRWDTVRICDNEKFRYWRYVSPQNGWCNIAEIMFINKDKRLDYEKIIASNERVDEFAPISAFDNDPLTYFEHTNRDGGWIGVDMGKPVSIEIFRFLPRNDDNNITIGHEYEIEMYDKEKKIALGKVKATSDSITFHNIPSNALYILHDKTKGTEERIFTFENNKINWY